MALKKNILIIIPREPYFSRARKNNTRILYEQNLIGFPLCDGRQCKVSECMYVHYRYTHLLLLLFYYYIDIDTYIILYTGIF